MIEAFLAAGDATGDARWFERALRIAERLSATSRPADWRVVEHFDAEWRRCPITTRSARATRSGRSASRRATASSGRGSCSRCAPASTRRPTGSPTPPGRCSVARSRRAGSATGGFVYTTDSTDGPSSPIGCTGRDRSIGAAAALHELTGDEEYERWYRSCWDFAGDLIDREHGSWHAELDESLSRAADWSGKPDVYHAFQATLIPRLPVRPSLAGALRDGSLA